MTTTATGEAACRCLVYLPHSYDGRGPAESCASILAAFRDNDIDTKAFLPRQRKPFSQGVDVVETLTGPTRHVPLRISSRFARHSLDRAFMRALDAADPAGTIAYFWPDVSLAVVRKARSRGIMTVREMINNPVVIAKQLLDRAYTNAGYAPRHGATPEKVAHEAVELPLYDHLFASNDEVEKSLRAIGIDDSRILPASFGWRADRYLGDSGRAPAGNGLTALYVGTIEVRKGVPELLAAWRDADVDGVLLLAGTLDPTLQPLVASHVATGKVRHLGFVEDMGALYRSADFLVFPTHEEGGPQVTIEAGGCGLPAITTPMGTGRFVKDGSTGIVVPPGDAAALAAAIGRMSASREGREKMGREARRAAAEFEYGQVGARRARMLIEALTSRRPVRGSKR